MLKNYELMRYDPISNLFLLAVVKLICFGHLVNHGLAATLLLIDLVDNRRYIYFFVAAREGVVRTKGSSERHLHLGRRLMDFAVAELGDVVEDIATLTLKDIQIGPDLPVYFAPRDPVSLPDKGDKLLEVPRLVDHVLGPNLTVTIDIGLCLRAVQHLPLAHRKQLVAVSALVEVVSLLLEQELQLLHEEATDQLVFSLFQQVQSVQRYFPGHVADDLGVDAPHIDLNFRDLLDVLDEELEALLDEPVDLQEVGADQDRHRVLDIQLGPIILLYGGLLGVRLSALGDSELPSAATTADALQGLVALLLLLEFLHRENVVEEPLEDDRVAVDADVDLVLV